jgi:hypothetical protein
MLRIEEKHLLTALQRVLYASKFDRSPEEAAEFAQSPYVAAVYRRVVDACIEAAMVSKKMNEVTGWESWLVAEKNAPAMNAVRGQVGITSNWNALGPQNKRDYIAILLSPFIASEETIDALVQEGDAMHRSDEGNGDPTPTPDNG